jgi:hypothetical protein
MFNFSGIRSNNFFINIPILFWFIIKKRIVNRKEQGKGSFFPRKPINYKFIISSWVVTRKKTNFLYLALCLTLLFGRAGYGAQDLTDADKNTFLAGRQGFSGVQEFGLNLSYDILESMPVTLNKPLEKKMDKLVLRQFRELNFELSVARTNLWFFPLGAIGSFGLGYMMIQVEPSNWWRTIIWVYGWAGIGSSVVAVGLTFYTVYHYFSVKGRLLKFRAEHGSIYTGYSEEEILKEFSWIRTDDKSQDIPNFIAPGEIYWRFPLFHMRFS